jgi:hypothetical protein
MPANAAIMTQLKSFGLALVSAETGLDWPCYDRRGSRDLYPGTCGPTSDAVPIRWISAVIYPRPHCARRRQFATNSWPLRHPES